MPARSGHGLIAKQGVNDRLLVAAIGAAPMAIFAC